MDEPSPKTRSARQCGTLKCYLNPACIWRFVSTLVTVVVLLVGAYAALRFLPQYAKTYDTMEDHFKYGSDRGDLVLGLPYWAWQALPLTCAETLQKVAGDRIPGDYLQRVHAYESGKDGKPEARRRELSREGYEAFGFIYEKGADGQVRDLPVGTAQRHSFGLDRVWINCAVCHTGTVRKDTQDPGRLVLGMPGNQFNLYAFEQFVFQCAKSENFNLLNMLPEIQALGGKLDTVDHYIVYPIALTLTRDMILYLDNLVGFSVRQPPWGPGRTDTFTPAKNYAGDNWRHTMPDYFHTGKVGSDTLGTADLPSIWLQGPRKVRSDGRQMELHWDGNNDTVEERNLDAALATGGLPPVIDHQSIECLEQWLLKLEPPKYPFPIDQQLAGKGAPIYAEYCADCHGRNGRDFEGKRVGFVTAIDDIRTDRYRLDNFTASLAQNIGTFYAEQKRSLRAHPCPGGVSYQPLPRRSAGGDPNSDYARLEEIDRQEGTYRFKHFHKTNGYANLPLDGLWLRAPYLHNGSVPSVRDLLEPADQRPPRFYRGNDIYDPKNAGFISDVPQDERGRKFFEFDTAIPGNANRGHDGHAYGTDLPADEKDALLEYLKTF